MIGLSALLVILANLKSALEILKLGYVLSIRRLYAFAPSENLKLPELMLHPIMVSSKARRFILPVLGIIIISSGIY
jgi:hypothetical protein